jgi:hypothetical protein
MLQLRTCWALCSAVSGTQEGQSSKIPNINDNLVEAKSGPEY